MIYIYGPSTLFKWRRQQWNESFSFASLFTRKMLIMNSILSNIYNLSRKFNVIWDVPAMSQHWRRTRKLITLQKTTSKLTKQGRAARKHINSMKGIKLDFFFIFFSSLIYAQRMFEFKCTLLDLQCLAKCKTHSRFATHTNNQSILGCSEWNIQ